MCTWYFCLNQLQYWQNVTLKFFILFYSEQQWSLRHHSGCTSGKYFITDVISLFELLYKLDTRQTSWLLTWDSVQVGVLVLVVRSGTVLPSETGRQCHGNMSMNKRTNTFKTSVKSHECCPLCSAIKATLLVLIMHVDRAGGMNGPQEENQLCPVCVQLQATGHNMTLTLNEDVCKDSGNLKPPLVSPHVNVCQYLNTGHWQTILFKTNGSRVQA